VLLRKEPWDAGPGRPRRAARTGLFIVSGGTGFAIMDYKHSAPLEPVLSQRFAIGVDQ
jgi:hypothetical protein